ncbi:hypothetical protein L596_013088 [Steinernema carpocapsae]|uniref:Uncharacterized protein n=1 Tax=Steinernema carpocapsae TaxID=34508 RepID=A0A4U5NZ62_STECR|nr:hypothetical protein L596_013088 [Steinernema carpocapsae]
MEKRHRRISAFASQLCKSQNEPQIYYSVPLFVHSPLNPKTLATFANSEFNFERRRLRNRPLRGGGDGPNVRKALRTQKRDEHVWIVLLYLRIIYFYP